MSSKVGDRCAVGETGPSTLGLVSAASELFRPSSAWWPPSRALTADPEVDIFHHATRWTASCLAEAKGVWDWELLVRFANEAWFDIFVSFGDSRHKQHGDVNGSEGIGRVLLGPPPRRRAFQPPEQSERPMGSAPAVREIGPCDWAAEAGERRALSRGWIGHEVNREPRSCQRASWSCACSHRQREAGRSVGHVKAM
jgi:hypothetical protein